ncbi:uncharacterized protein A4U43_C02F590 [Asparagus officinalis]|uniref:PAR1 protein n=1 Tax=Asparagus officinalis TaxID=4686 RepID=A0A5P1FJV1_ASPOF|nr:uncharacterized protein A4U43_C02F590 [Asparagus officinalis]
MMPSPLLLVSLSLLLPSALAAADVICENLPKNQCAFAVSSSSKRCILESYRGVGAQTEYECGTSDIGVARISAHVETDECINSCGVDRNSVGISSDLLTELRFLDRLCSPECFQRCANIIDLYYNLAAAEGRANLYQLRLFLDAENG